MILSKKHTNNYLTFHGNLPNWRYPELLYLSELPRCKEL